MINTSDSFNIVLILIGFVLFVLSNIVGCMTLLNYKLRTKDTQVFRGGGFHCYKKMNPSERKYYQLSIIFFIFSILLFVYFGNELYNAGVR